MIVSVVGRYAEIPGSSKAAADELRRNPLIREAYLGELQADVPAEV
jgi:hypothetical protein